jgi:hypothetical protein
MCNHLPVVVRRVNDRLGYRRLAARPGVDACACGGARLVVEVVDEPILDLTGLSLSADPARDRAVR